ncbi:MAG: D-alanine--D-alanine ligase, partial [Patescibacteria group bacterium]|nr:D-alanine--D-alanine ligase [Patescibacteria group bacterium]
MNKIRVGVLRGGPSSEYEVSLKTGGNVLKNLPEKYSPVDIFIDKSGVWHIQGIPHKPHESFKKVDAVFNALHGEYGEDGTVQKILDTFSVPYTGSKALASALGMNKALAKNIFKSHGIKTPYFTVESKDKDVGEIAIKLFNSFPMPAVVKPIASGSSVGVSIAYTFQGLKDALLKAFEYSDKALIEEYVKGREATCGVVDDFRGKDIYSLLPIEIIKPEKSEFFD